MLLCKLSYCSLVLLEFQRSRDSSIHLGATSLGLLPLGYFREREEGTSEMAGVFCDLLEESP